MTTITLRGVPVSFPFEPYELQKDYMEKVIECLQNETNAVLESPTGTGKTLSLLCSTLAWLQMKKAQIQVERQSGLPVVLYASRTHSQLTQAMQELKRTAYSYMKACVLGSREQMCIHEDLAQEQNNNIKRQMCSIKVKSRSCHYFNRVEKYRDHPDLKGLPIVDIEDIVTIGKKHKFCPFYMSRELVNNADIIFLPYNYLLDPVIRDTVLKGRLTNAIVILDEAHNVEKQCEEAGSVQIKASDIALAIEEVTAVMKVISDENLDYDDTPKDFSCEDLCKLKECLLELEKVLDEVKVGTDGGTFEGTYVFEIFGKAGITMENQGESVILVEKIIQFLSVTADGPFARRGVGLQNLVDVLHVVFSGSSADFVENVKRCCKVHIIEEKKKNKNNWLTNVSKKDSGKIVNFWCFSPGFGMNMFMKGGSIRSLILTSGTLAPLRPLISELELDVPVRLENPHIVTSEQVCVKILTAGPDKQPLNCSFQNRDNVEYMRSLGMSIQNLSKIIPNGILIFFPSYPIMQKCQDVWQQKGIWSNICMQKPMYVEPRDKATFSSVMQEYYQKVVDPAFKGAIFMGVCRGKVSEGLDFIDANGRAVIIVGLPYPPLKDPKVILKRKYMDSCHARDKDFLRGEEWYTLEATRAVNQAIGRVIRHKNDYGAILLLDARFNNPRIKMQMSRWLREHIKLVNNFGELMRDLRTFYKNAETKFPCTGSKPKSDKPVPAEFSSLDVYKSCDLYATESEASTSDGGVTIHDRYGKNPTKKMKLTMTKHSFMDNDEPLVQNENKEKVMKEYIEMIKTNLDLDNYRTFIAALRNYRDTFDFNKLKLDLDVIFEGKFHLRFLILGLETYIKPKDKKDFQNYLEGNV